MQRRVVLIGAGHAHVEILRRWALSPPPNAQLCVVTDRERAVYSGMVPGFVAGDYDESQLSLDVTSLARRADAELLVTAATRIAANERRIETADGASVDYSLASLDIGSDVAGKDVPGVRDHSLPTRPIAELIARVEELDTRARERSPMRVAVVGGGAGGVELAFCLEARFRRASPSAPPRVCLVDSAPRVLSGASPKLQRRVERAADRRGIELLTAQRVEALEAAGLKLAGGGRIDADAVVWATGAAAHPLGRDSGLPVDAGGFIEVRPTYQVAGFDDLFAAGDCASFTAAPRLPKAGVHAVRAGPVLWRNLLAALEGRALESHRPQRDFLTLLNVGDGRAIGAKRGVAFEGRWVMRLKDRIDRRFMSRYD